MPTGTVCVEVARALETADAFARRKNRSRAGALRSAGFRQRIVVMSPGIDVETTGLARTHGLDVVIQRRTSDSACLRTRRGSRLSWRGCKVDTGMGRLGITPERARSALDALRRCTRCQRHRADDTPGASRRARQRAATGDQLAYVSPRSPRTGRAMSASQILRAFSRGPRRWPHPTRRGPQLGPAGSDALRRIAVC